ncbi:MAG: efflux transporter outer membrane subunit [bacterium]
MRARYLFVAISVALWTLSCAVHQVRHDALPPASVPEHFSDSGGTVDPPDRWWVAFNDPALNTLVESTLSDNLDLGTAWARLDQARALARIAGANNSPTLDLSTGARRGRMQEFMGTTTDSQFSLGFSTAYEVDLWKRIDSLESAAELDVLATRQDLEATALALTSQVAQFWFSIIEQRSQRGLLSDQIQISETFLELVELRFGQGRASAVDVYQQREQVASVRAQIPNVESRTQVLLNQLAVLLGQSPTTDVSAEGEELPELPPQPLVGIPMELLQKRPDIRSAQIRIAAADHRLAAAIADRLPTLRLGGQSSYGGSEIGDLFSNWMWNLAANLVTPVIDGGRRKAEVERNRAVITERLHQYEKAVLTALQEVENVLVREQKQTTYVKELETQLDIARKTLEESRSRYTNGLTDYLPVLTALQSVQRLERTLLTAHLDLISFRIDLYRSLGGAWTSELVGSEQ